MEAMRLKGEMTRAQAASEEQAAEAKRAKEQAERQVSDMMGSVCCADPLPPA